MGTNIFLEMLSCRDDALLSFPKTMLVCLIRSASGGQVGDDIRIHYIDLDAVYLTLGDAARVQLGQKA